MRHLTAAGAAAVMLAAGIVAATAAGADPTITDPTAEPSTAELSTAEPTDTAETPAPGAPAGAHQVTYTVTTTSDLTANIYYVTGDPPDQGAANDPQYMPLARTLVGPGAPWIFQTTLDDPTRWAFVSASGGLRVNPEFRCEIAVDGQVVVSQQGGSGVQCALSPR